MLTKFSSKLSLLQFFPSVCAIIIDIGWSDRMSDCLSTARWAHYGSGSQTVVRVPRVVREGISGSTRAAFLSYSKSFVNSFLCYNSFVCYANVANSFISYINLKYI